MSATRALKVLGPVPLWGEGSVTLQTSRQFITKPTHLNTHPSALILTPTDNRESPICLTLCVLVM